MFITSFKRSIYYPEVQRWSSAVYQPTGYNYPKADWMDIRIDGAWTRPRDFIFEENPLNSYFEALWGHYVSRIDLAEEWMTKADPSSVICCWCPYDKAAQRQLKTHGTFVCHTAIVGKFLNELGVDITYDADREKMVMF